MTFDVADFTKSGNTLIADASDLGLAPGVSPAEQISIVYSPEHIEHFRHFVTEMDGYEGVTGWRYCKTNPFNRAATVLIVND